MDPSIRIEGLHDEEEPPVGGLALLIDATARHDGHRPIGEHALVELQAGPREFPHAAFAARLGDDLAGYAHLSQRETHLGWRFEAFVAPEHRRLGIGRALVAAVLDHAADDGGGAVHAWAYNPGPAQARLAARFAMRHVRTIARMLRSLPGPDPRLPAGFRLRSFRPDDVSTWLAVHNEVFVDHPDGGNWREPDLAWHLEEPWFDPELFVIAEDDAGMAGYCWMKPESDTAWLYFLGVRSTARGRGLGQALAAEGLARAAALGAVVVQLYVDADSEPAIRTYRALAFTIDHVDRAYALDVAPTTRAEPTRG
ncbi:MAG TPA: mycothiol synthase [Actinomycetota bacterium]|nr:mycothiol synthase [Actinomycetota bacterium]